jgi:hypothetical protein
VCHEEDDTIHVCHMRRMDTCVSYEEEDTCIRIYAHV